MAQKRQLSGEELADVIETIAVKLARQSALGGDDLASSLNIHFPADVEQPANLGARILGRVNQLRTQVEQAILARTANLQDA